MGRPTFDQIRYAPDLDEQLTLAQAKCFRERFVDQIIRLGQLILEELNQRGVSASRERALAIDVFTPNELVQYCRPRELGKGIYAGQIGFKMSSGSVMPIGLMVEWDTEEVLVYWGLLRPEPDWRRLTDRRS